MTKKIVLYMPIAMAPVGLVDDEIHWILRGLSVIFMLGNTS